MLVIVTLPAAVVLPQQSTHLSGQSPVVAQPVASHLPVALCQPPTTAEGVCYGLRSKAMIALIVDMYSLGRCFCSWPTLIAVFKVMSGPAAEVMPWQDVLASRALLPCCVTV